MNQQMEDMIKEAVSDADLTLSEIPSIDLYLDQILSLVSEKNEQGSDRYKERVLTKTMINNYSKEGAILPIKGKKYNRSQILQILFIYSLKNTLSIAEIKRIFEATYALEDFGENEFSSLWNDYLKMKDHSRTETARICETVEAGCALDLEKDEDYMRLILSLVSLSSYLKILAETMIDKRFPEPADEKQEKAEKEEKKKEKEREKEREKEKNKEKEKEKQREKEKEKEKNKEKNKDKKNKEKDKKEQTENSDGTPAE